jgi:hypothetical protein
MELMETINEKVYSKKEVNMLKWSYFSVGAIVSMFMTALYFAKTE